MCHPHGKVARSRLHARSIYNNAKSFAWSFLRPKTMASTPIFQGFKILCPEPPKRDPGDSHLPTQNYAKTSSVGLGHRT